MDNGGASSQSSQLKIIKRIKFFLLPFARQKIKAKQIGAQEIVLQNAQIPINQLPVELFLKIISFAARPTIQRPYPYVALSSVCRCWRSALLGNAIFWKTLVLRPHRIDPMFVEELLKRSRDVPLSIVTNRLDELTQPCFFSVAGRVKTLYLNDYWIPRYQDSRLSDLISSFLLLENVFFDYSYPTNINLLPAFIQIQVKVMQITIQHLGNLAIPGHFRELTWLSLEYEMNSIPLLSVLEALHNLPNLQILRLFWSLSRGIPETKELAENSKSILTLPKLTVLISNISLLHLIHAPKLLYLDIIPQFLYSVHSYDDGTYNRLCGFDFSRITHICSGMGKIHGSGPPHVTWDPTYQWHKSLNAFQFVPRKYRNHNSLEWTFGGFPASELDYPNEFYLSFFGTGDLLE
ncbi:hypothetical protein Clacol_010433 [Clathrus columnatus]|uniref:F-box domain-containing protein n=1 Tax=Clathrus columnatus TaxID=1419009 RepID=A0AAV5AU35_9AGAM|nr:hypothetical protein Clacol_010433 [Clathrus columnatus]